MIIYLQYMLTNHTESILPVQNCPLEPCACPDGSGMNFEPVPITAEGTSLTASSCSGSNYSSVQWQRSHSA